MDSRKQKKIVDEILNITCKIWKTPRCLNYTLKNELTDENKSKRETTDYFRIACDGLTEDNETVFIDITKYIAMLFEIDSVSKEVDGKIESYFPITHRNNEKIKDICADLNREIIGVFEKYGYVNAFQHGYKLTYIEK